MLVKFWGINQGGGDGDGSVNYLLNERVKQGTAKVLKGDANLTKSLLLSLTQKHKACVGCLSFEEPNIDENLKHELIESFENALLTESMQNRYNILWVEHTDKGRLELNFVIPKIDLERQKAFNPYYHKVDLKRIDTWQNVVNLKYIFTNPKDLKKQQISNYHNTKTPQGKAIFKNYKELDNYLYNAVTQGLLNSRAEIIELLQASNYEITRQGKDYISVKLPNQQKAKRLKGIIYDERFTEQRLIEQELREYSQKKDTSRKRDTREKSTAPNTTPRATQSLIQELRDLEQQLHRHIEHKQRYYERLFQTDSSNPRGFKEQLPGARESQQRTQQDYTSEVDRPRETMLQKPNQEILTDAIKFSHGVSRNGSNINGGILSNHSALQKQGIRAFTDNVRADFTTRITERSNQRARGFTSSMQRIENTIRDFRNNSQTRARTILHNIYARTRDAINAIKDIYRNAKERIRDFFQRADERISKRMEQETRDLHAKTTQLDRKIREHNQKIENSRSSGRSYR